MWWFSIYLSVIIAVAAPVQYCSHCINRTIRGRRSRRLKKQTTTYLYWWHLVTLSQIWLLLDSYFHPWARTLSIFCRKCRHQCEEPDTTTDNKIPSASLCQPLLRVLSFTIAASLKLSVLAGPRVSMRKQNLFEGGKPAAWNIDSMSIAHIC